MPILDRWFTEAPEPLVPTNQQKQAVIKLLKTRHDAEQLQDAIKKLERPQS